MLIDTMTPQELSSEISKDWHIIVHTTINRLFQLYDRERRRSKISRDEVYIKFYEIKTKTKNKWIFIFIKALADEKYKGMESIAFSGLVYYYSTVGLRVFKIIPDENGGNRYYGLAVFNSHFFTRYNERMNLGLNVPLDIVNHFFSHNTSEIARFIPKDGREFVLTVCKDGLLLGEVQENRTWIVYKTFITRDLTHSDQRDIEQELIDNLQKEIEDELNKPQFNKDKYLYNADIIKGIKD